MTIHELQAKIEGIALKTAKNPQTHRGTDETQAEVIAYALKEAMGAAVSYLRARLKEDEAAVSSLYPNERDR